jgi:hypothetical protein
MRVRDVILSNADDAQTHREKLVRIVLDEMYQFVGLLAASGHALEINRPALEEVGIQPDESLIVGGDSNTSMADSDGRHTGYGRSIGLSYKIPGVGPAGLLAPENSGPQTVTFCSRSSSSISLGFHSYKSDRTFLSHSGFVGLLSEQVLPVSCNRRYQNLACPALVFSQSKCEASPCTPKISALESGERKFFAEAPGSPRIATSGHGNRRVYERI